MPSLIRFLAIVGVLVGIVYASFYTLAVFFEPEQKEITKPIYGIQLQQP